jgi:hypothetical protein
MQLLGQLLNPTRGWHAGFAALRGRGTSLGNFALGTDWDWPKGLANGGGLARLPSCWLIPTVGHGV